MSKASRPTPDRFADATWEQILPAYDALADRPLDLAGAEAWLADWSALEVALDEAKYLAEIAFAGDTADPAKEAAHRRFSGEIGPLQEEQQVRLAARLLGTGYDRSDMDTTLRRFRNRQDLYRAENVRLRQRLEDHNARYQKVAGGMTAPWDGDELPLPRLAPFLLDRDRTIRERAFRLRLRPFVEHRDAIAAIFDEQFAIRQEIARNAGFANYRDYAFRELERFDYGVAECEAFHAAVEVAVVPALARRREARRTALGMETLRPWDLQVDAHGRPPLRPAATGADLADRAQAVFDGVDPDLGRYWTTMRTDGLLDLDSRKGKAPGGFCTDLPYRKQAFIFMNASGVPEDVETLLHEAGHCFHAFEAMALPTSFQWFPGAEMSEVASMAMELLAAPYLGDAEGGFYTAEDARRARIDHLDSILSTLPWIATVDAFQHWIYSSGQGDDREARDREWIKMYARFDPAVDWSELEAERIARWYRQLHIFLYPFYYIEYGIAQLGALQVWGNSKRDQARAVADYRRALALGNTRPLPELFEAAGARLTFDEATMGELVGQIEAELAELEG